MFSGHFQPVALKFSFQHRALLNFRSAFSSVSLTPTSTSSFLAKLIPLEKYLKGRIPGIRDRLSGGVKKRKKLTNGRWWHPLKNYFKARKAGYMLKKKKKIPDISWY